MGVIRDLWHAYTADRDLRRHVGDGNAVLLFRTTTPHLYPVGGLWEDQRGEWWRVTRQVGPLHGPGIYGMSEVWGDRAGPLRGVE